jgi:tRNA dimethylallyltransferase
MVRPVCILGPTASGKSSVAMAVAEKMPLVELVSVDSMQVYREMDIGTAKPSIAEQELVRHHLIDIADPAEDFAVSTFQHAWHAVAADLRARGRIPLLVGGTGLYLRSVIDELEFPGQFPEVRAELEGRVSDLGVLYGELKTLDPVAASRIDPNNERRVTRALEVTLGSGRPFSSFGPGLIQYPDTNFTLLGLRMDLDLIDDRVDQRYDMQMEQGFLDEVVALSERPEGVGRTARQALGYRELLHHVEQGVPLDEVLRDAKVRTHRFARRQMKWFRRDPRIEWIDLDSSGTVDHGAAIERALSLVGHTET